MNLPGSALEFLDAFRGSYTPLLSVQKEGGEEGERLKVEEVEMPLVHVHCFSKFEGTEAEEDVAKVSSLFFHFRLVQTNASLLLLFAIGRHLDSSFLSSTPRSRVFHFSLFLITKSKN